MKITLTVKEWEQLRDQLMTAYPAWQFSAIISQLLIQARNVIYPNEAEVEG